MSEGDALRAQLESKRDDELLEVLRERYSSRALTYGSGPPLAGRRRS